MGEGLWLAVALGDGVTVKDAVALGVNVGVDVGVALDDAVPEVLAVALGEGVRVALAVTEELEEPEGVAVGLAELVVDGDAVADTVRRDARLRPWSVMRATSVALPSHSTASSTPLASRPLGTSCVTLTVK